MTEAIIPTVLISVNKAGHMNQCLAFCELMNWPVTETNLMQSARRMNPMWREVQKFFKGRAFKCGKIPRRRQWNRLRIVASGLSAEDLVLRYRELYGPDLFAVFVGAPRSLTPIFDVAVASHHELDPGEPPAGPFQGAADTQWIAGVLTRSVTKTKVPQDDKLVVVLIGGANRAFTIEPRKIIEQLAPALARDDRLAVVFSRRTAVEVEDHLRGALKAPNVTFVDRGDRAGYENAFAQAREFYVTPDSITMVCEACSSRKPVTVFEMDCFDLDTPTASFVNEFTAARYVRTAGTKTAEGIVQVPALETIKRAVELRHESWIAR